MLEWTRKLHTAEESEVGSGTSWALAVRRCSNSGRPSSVFTCMQVKGGRSVVLACTGGSSSFF